MNELKVGDTIKCKNFPDMLQVIRELSAEGIIVNILKNYTIQIKSIMEGDSEC